MIAASYRKQGIGKVVVEVVDLLEKMEGKHNSFRSSSQYSRRRNSRQRNGYRIVSEPKLQPDQTIAVDLRKDFNQGV